MKIEFIGAGKVKAAMKKVERDLKKDANRLIAGAALRTEQSQNSAYNLTRKTVVSRRLRLQRSGKASTTRTTRAP